MIINPAVRLKLTSTTSSGVTILKPIHMALALIVIAWMNFGLFSYALPYIPNIIRYGFYFAWLGLAIVGNKDFVKTFIIQAWPLLLFYFYMILMSYFVGTDLGFFIRNLGYLIMVYSIFLYYFNGNSRRFQQLLCVFLILDCVAIGINTFIQLQIDPRIARFLTTGLDPAEGAAFLGVGSYLYFYPLVAIILLLTFLLLNQRKYISLLILLIALSIAVLIQAAFTIAILLTFIFVISMTIIRYTGKYTFIALVLIGIITLLMFTGVFAAMFEQLAGIEGLPYDVSVRFYQFANLFAVDGNDVSGTVLEIRTSKYLYSLDLFLNNILTGGMATNSNSGGHSSWLDLLATYGVFSFLLFIFLYQAYKYCKDRVPRMFMPFVKIYWLYFILVGLINPILYSTSYIMWFLFLPMFISCYFQKETN